MAEHRHCPCCELSWTRANTETYDRSVEIAAARVAREHTPEARTAFSEAVRREAKSMSDHMQVWRLGSCPDCGGDLKGGTRSKARKQGTRRRKFSAVALAVLAAVVAIAVLIPGAIAVCVGSVEIGEFSLAAAGVALGWASSMLAVRMLSR